MASVNTGSALARAVAMATAIAADTAGTAEWVLLTSTGVTEPRSTDSCLAEAVVALADELANVRLELRSLERVLASRTDDLA